MQDCVSEKLVGDTNAAVAQYAVGLKHTLALCNADKRALRDWASKVDKTVK